MNFNSTKCLTALSLACLLSMTTANAEDVVANPDGYHVVPTQNTPGTAVFKANVDRGAQTIEYELSWQNLKGDITQSHIHFGRPASNGDIALFLCTNLGNTPVTAAKAPPCPNAGGDLRTGSVKGVLTAGDIVALAFGGILPAQQLLPFANFDELADAIDAGATYVVVHTTAQPPGELRDNIETSQSQGSSDVSGNSVANAQPVDVLPDDRLLKGTAGFNHP